MLGVPVHVVVHLTVHILGSHSANDVANVTDALAGSLLSVTETALLGG